ncbi:hypothetical protein MUO93_08530 [Candidatus Bathyarchaeota archaeon]|nr:hypothetical protein [Candidatus Bathyarchaeota archaeon]
MTNVNSIKTTVEDISDKLWSNSDSVKSDTSHITNTVTNRGSYTLPASSPIDFYSIIAISVPQDKAAQFTVTVHSVASLQATLYVWVDVDGDLSNDMSALKLDLNSPDNYETTTFVAHSFVLRVDVSDPPPLDKKIDWAYMVIAPNEVPVTETLYYTL